MKRDSNSDTVEITAAYKSTADASCERLAKNQRVRRNVPNGGRLRMDRQLPFLCIFRSGSDPAAAVTDLNHQLVTTEAAYLFASGEPSHDEGLTYLVDQIRAAMQEHFGLFLLIEVTVDDALGFDFQISSMDESFLPSTLEVMEKELSVIQVGDRPARVDRTTKCETILSRGLSPDSSGTTHCSICLRVRPFYRDRDSGKVFPLVLQRLRQQLARAYRRTVAEFTSGDEKPSDTHHQTFGPSALVKAARLVDKQLCDVADSFDYLLQVTPTNADRIRHHFCKDADNELLPLQYRHLPYHPNLLKRRLFAIEIERVEDPTLAFLFWEKQDEIDRQLTSLRDLHMPETTIGDHPQYSNFLSSSLQLYGGPEDPLVELATAILERSSKHDRPSAGLCGKEDVTATECVNAAQLAAAAREEISYYQKQMCEFSPSVEISKTIASGIMVSKDRLLISDSINISAARVAPLLHHEIGTHLLTYFNGRCQPFRQLSAGLAGYDELQEGLAVLAEYLVGGLTVSRLRTLAARVIATDMLVSGTPFAKVVDVLKERYGFKNRSAFNTTLRVFRGGGLTKDVIYLRGLQNLLEYLAAGHDIEPLYVGKIGLQHIPYIQELRRRGIITPPRLLPRFWDDPKCRERLEAVRGKSVLNLTDTD